MLKCMFDTNIFNRILDGVIGWNELGHKIIAYATHIQRDEIDNTANSVRRDALKQIFESATSGSIPTNSFVLDVSRLDEACLGNDHVVPTESLVWEVTAWGHGKWGVGDLYMALQADLDNLNKGKANNIQDALIAETSIRGGYVLVTDDRDLAAVTKKHGGQCMSLQELLKTCNT